MDRASDLETERKFEFAVFDPGTCRQPRSKPQALHLQPKFLFDSGVCSKFELRSGRVVNTIVESATREGRLGRNGTSRVLMDTILTNYFPWTFQSVPEFVVP